MPDGAQYEVFYGDLGELKEKLKQMPAQGYRPIVMSPLGDNKLVVILERTNSND